MHLVRFAHGEVDVPAVAIYHPYMIECRLSEIGSHQFAVDELYPVEGTSGERDVGEIALPENNIGYLGRFESGINKSDVTESTLFDTPVGSVDSRFHTFGEGKPVCGFFFFEEFFQWFETFGWFFHNGRCERIMDALAVLVVLILSISFFKLS